MSETSTESTTRILVVDDHSVVREGLTRALNSKSGLSVIGCVCTGKEAVLAARRLEPDVIIMDLILPELDGIDATLQILAELPRTGIIAFSGCHAPEHVYRALRAGARGFVLKSAPTKELLLAIEAVSTGTLYVSPAMTALFVDGVLRTSIPRSPFDVLSTRERAVLRGIVAGSTSNEIATALSLSRKTVDTYRSRIMTKLGVPNRSSLIRFAVDFNLPDA